MSYAKAGILRYRFAAVLRYVASAPLTEGGETKFALRCTDRKMFPVPSRNAGREARVPNPLRHTRTHIHSLSLCVCLSVSLSVSLSRSLWREHARQGVQVTTMVRIRRSAHPIIVSRSCTHIVLASRDMQFSAIEFHLWKCRNKSSSSNR